MEESPGLLIRVVWCKFTDVSKVLDASIIALTMEVASTFVTSVNLYHITGRNIPEGDHLPVEGNSPHKIFLRRFFCGILFSPGDKIKSGSLICLHANNVTFTLFFPLIVAV
jgi:hypothetical protein